MNSQMLATIFISSIIFVITISNTEAKPANYILNEKISIKSINKNKVIQVCGKELADLLQRTCDSIYNDYVNLSDIEKENDMIGNWAERTSKRRGITQECCYQACSIANLLTYCYNTSSVIIEIFENSTHVETIEVKPLSVIKKSFDGPQVNEKNNDIHIPIKNNDIVLEESEVPPMISNVENDIEIRKTVVNPPNVKVKSINLNKIVSPNTNDKHK